MKPVLATKQRDRQSQSATEGLFMKLEFIINCVGTNQTVTDDIRREVLYHLITLEICRPRQNHVKIVLNL